ncbi:hypothetical protein V2J09_012741 [Rumex salicifolius]
MATVKAVVIALAATVLVLSSAMAETEEATAVGRLSEGVVYERPSEVKLTEGVDSIGDET